MSAEWFYYLIFPWMARWKNPEKAQHHLWKLGLVWALGLIPGTLYLLLLPDGIAHPNRFSYGPWLQALKYTPLSHLASFIFGVLLAGMDAVMPRPGLTRLLLGVSGFAALFLILASGRMPYALLHDGLLMPCFGCMIIGLAGENLLARIIGSRPLVFVGEASYCLYLLHFNMWNLIHDTHVLDRLGLNRFDPWISYVLLVLMALLALHFIEKPVQRQLRNWMHASG
jgi:peptidoglycan/LPS O-acetylase OafA/YrhL